mmetsp:Transcript_39159/g.50627  ORF Transcript_39159/g.50627 Transcript_39159/m.50627 type:complete len:165 (+) Transcript_39159:56-550(+)
MAPHDVELTKSSLPKVNGSHALNETNIPSYVEVNFRVVVTKNNSSNNVKKVSVASVSTNKNDIELCDDTQALVTYISESIKNCSAATSSNGSITLNMSFEPGNDHPKDDIIANKDLSSNESLVSQEDAVVVANDIISVDAIRESQTQRRRGSVTKKVDVKRTHT